MSSRMAVGSPMTPAMIIELGAAGDFPFAPAEFSPTDEWVHTYRVWICHGNREKGKSVLWHEYIVTEMPSNRARMVRSQRYKYANYFEDPVEMLFDMVNDPGETRNLSADPAYAGVLLEHRKMLQKWELQLDTAPNVPNPDAWRHLV